VKIAMAAPHTAGIGPCREEGGLAIDGNGTPVEWAVEMARFDETLGLDRVAATTELQPALAVAVRNFAVFRSMIPAIESSHERPWAGADWSWARRIVSASVASNTMACIVTSSAEFRNLRK
jgi:uncharacterized protein